MSSKDANCRTADGEVASPNLTGVRLFKSLVRQVRQKITENKLTKSASLGDGMPTIVAKLEELSVGSADSSPHKSSSSRSPPCKEALRRFFGTSRTSSEDKLRSCSGYSSDSGTERQTRGNDYRVRIRQNVRSRSKSYSRRSEKKPKKILRPPATYVYVRGPSGLVSHRVRVH